MGCAKCGPTATIEPVGNYAGLGGRGLTSTIIAKEVDPLCHPLSAANKPCWRRGCSRLERVDERSAVRGLQSPHGRHR